MPRRVRLAPAPKPTPPSGRSEGPIRRARQFFLAVGRARRGLLPEDWRFVDAYLAPGERALFARMTRADQAHCVAVARAALLLFDQEESPEQRGEEAPEESRRVLVAAALLHDVGKSGTNLGLLARVAVVLVQAWAPRWARAFEAGDEPSRGWAWLGAARRALKDALRAQREHAVRGAQMAAAAGSDPRVVALIRDHHRQAPAEGLLALLMEADRRF